jgi:type VI secretion system secreted protein Hcp
MRARTLFSILVLGVASLSAEQPASADAASPVRAAAPQSTAPVRKAAALLKFDGIDGESTDSKHRGWVEVSSFSWESTRQAGPVASGAGAGKANLSSLAITKQPDKATTRLQQASALGTHIRSVVFEFVNPTKHEVYQVTMSDVLVSSFHVSGGDQGGERPTESLSLNFAKMEVQYTPQKSDGTLGPSRSVEAGWDLKANTKI